ncbi:MAG: hypothetical protein Kow0080_20950 [Candidatus Promineifilaceae bacterium]
MFQVVLFVMKLSCLCVVFFVGCESLCETNCTKIIYEGEGGGISCDRSQMGKKTGCAKLSLDNRLTFIVGDGGGKAAGAKHSLQRWHLSRTT